MRHAYPAPYASPDVDQLKRVNRCFSSVVELRKQMQPPASQPGLHAPTHSPEPPSKPWWVTLSLWGVPGRTSMWVFFWISLAIAVGSIAWGFSNPLFFVGGLMAFAAIWYWAAIRWMDRNNGWPRK